MAVKQGKVFLVGAGPGDPGLLTIKGRELLTRAEVVVYDRLVGQGVMAYASPQAELVYVGKSPEGHTLRQEEINALLVDLGRSGKTVVRLKGGDPFVFGRGGEEAEALRQAGLSFEVVPGITSAVAVPAYAGIPVSHRNLTSTIGIITGNEDPTKDDSSIDWHALARGCGTMVFLMGMGNLPLISRRLQEAGRDPGTPVAAIRWGTRPEQVTLTGTLGDIAQRAQEAGLANPAVVVVGEVVALRERLAWFEHLPLFGRRVVVTRSREQASTLAARITALGGEAWEFPAIRVEPPADWSGLDAAQERLGTYGWLVFTSANGVRFFFERLRERGRDIRDLGRARICAIGPQTARALSEKGLRVDLVPPEYRAEGIVAGLGEVGGQRILLARADIARRVLPEELRAGGALVDEVVAYRTVRGGGDAEQLRLLLKEQRVAAVTFTSSSTVKNLVELLAPDSAEELLRGVTVASIGPITSQTAREAGLTVDVEASEYTIDGLVQALVAHWQGSGRQ